MLRYPAPLCMLEKDRGGATVTSGPLRDKESLSLSTMLPGD
jgi:hypothetical protein